MRISGAGCLRADQGSLIPLAMAAIVWIALSACDRPGGDTLHVDRFPRLTVEADARIGDFDDPDIGFTFVGGVDVDRDGNIYVLELAVPEIRVYSPGGELLRRIGQRGAGPGEFESPPRFGVVGDTVWTVEPGPNRITLFDREGTVLSTGRTDGLRVPLPGRQFGHVLPWRMRPDGQFAGNFSYITYPRDTAPTGVQPTDSIPFPWVLFDPTGSITDTLGWAPKPPPRMWRPPSEDDIRFRWIQVGDQRFTVPAPPTALPWWEPLLDGYLVVDTPRPTDGDDAVFTVSRLGLHGDTVYSRTLHYEPVPYAAAELDSIAARAARGEPGGMVGYVPGRPPPPNWERAARALRTSMDFPEHQLPVEYPWLAPDGAVWLRMNDRDPATARWAVLDPDGRPRGRLELPADVRIVWTRGDTFWAVDPDELDVPWLVRYRMGRSR